jgi:hypothetical protein
MIKMTMVEAQEHLADLINHALNDEPVFILLDDDRAVMLMPAHIGKGYGAVNKVDGSIWMSDDFDEPLEDFKAYME